MRISAITAAGIFVIHLLPSLHARAAVDVPAEFARYNVVWTEQSKGAGDSMPLAGGVLGLNVWVENDDLHFLIGSPDCFDGNGMQVKLGRVKLHFSPDVFEKDFRQELDLAKSEIIVSGKTAENRPIAVRLWCDVFKPVIHTEISAADAVSVEVSYETWSNYDAKFTGDGLEWVRRLDSVNARRTRDMKAQGVGEFAAAVPDPLSNLTEGGRLLVAGMKPAGTGTGKLGGMDLRTWTLKTEKPAQKLDLIFALRMEQDRSLREWETRVAATARQAAANAVKDREASLAWWREFWSRGYIIINPTAVPTDRGWQVGRNYQLFRYMLAANRTGKAPTLFNGGVFACTGNGSGNPDKRNWDGCQYMAQNQRLIYWPMLKSGDFDLLKVALDFYRDRATLARLHAKKFWGVDGLVYPEAFSLFGLDSIGTRPNGRAAPAHLEYHYTSGMEFALMMLEWGSYSGTDVKNYLASAEGIISYYDEYYQKLQKEKTGKPLDVNGHLVIYPSCALETFQGCTNNTDVIAGLTALSDALLALPAKDLSPRQRAYLRAFQKRLPPVAIKELDGHRVIAPAESWESVMPSGNMEFSNLYVCFPFSTYMLGRSDMEVVRNTWDFAAINPGVQKQYICWYQSAINLARMGRTEEAKQYTLRKFLHQSARFPAFWDNHGYFCECPDVDHGGSAMIGLQEMLMQCDGKRILLAPAWPRDWNCQFKLHAPYGTTVEGQVQDGKLVVTQVTPDSRRADIEILGPARAPPRPLSEGKTATASSVWGAGYDAAKAVDADLGTRWSMAAGQTTGWIAVDLGKPMQVSRAVIREIGYPNVTKFALEAQQAEGAWQEVAGGTTIGASRELKFAPVSARCFRVNILAGKANASFEEFQLFEK